MSEWSSGQRLKTRENGFAKKGRMLFFPLQKKASDLKEEWKRVWESQNVSENVHEIVLKENSNITQQGLSFTLYFTHFLIYEGKRFAGEENVEICYFHFRFYMLSAFHSGTHTTRKLNGKENKRSGASNQRNISD